MSDPPPATAPRPLVSRLRAGQWFAVAGTALAAVLVVCLVLGAVAIVNLSDARDRVVNQLDPARVATLKLLNAYLNQETGMRGFALSSDRSLLAPYTLGQDQERDALTTLRARIAGLDLPNVARDLGVVQQRAAAWKADYVQPALQASLSGSSTAVAKAATAVGKERFDELRAAITTLENGIVAARDQGRTDLDQAAGFLTAAFIGIAALLLVATAIGAVLLRRIISRPLLRLSSETRLVARGEFDHEVTGGGARDIYELGQDIASMQERIVQELDALRGANVRLDEQALDLRRSNAELEQFAYVASHDLQEPLRKVASFTQLLQRRYGDQLDERADQYIEFAVDGAKRMQQLINDLLAFSRVGRAGSERRVVSLEASVRDAQSNLSDAIAEGHATIDVGPLPEVRGEPALLTAVFQNLIGNAVKFRGDAPAHVAVSAKRLSDAWEFTVADDGIGIESEYAERIFVLFQRLHPKDAYAGTGIGLALSRKIVEYHGGRIWLDTSVAAGTTFRFTLPLLEENA